MLVNVDAIIVCSPRATVQITYRHRDRSEERRFVVHSKQFQLQYFLKR